MKIVLAYSGGLDTSVLVSWLKEHYSAEIITFAADIGQEEELSGLEEKAIATGATRHYTVDLVEEFARDFIFPMMRGNALYENQYHLGTSIARPLIAKAQLAIAAKEQADAVAHGATGKGNDQVRFELTFAALAPDIQIVSPWRMQVFRDRFPGRSEMIDYCRENGINVEATAKKPYSMDRNLLHISYEAGILEDPWFNPMVAENRDMYKLTRHLDETPEVPVSLVLSFEDGNCVAIDGEQMSPAKVLQHLNELAGIHGIGRVDIVENRFVGMKSRGVYETPGGTVLLHARKQMETLAMDRDLEHLRDSLIPKYGELIYNGFWYAPEREALQAFFDKSQEKVTGDVRLQLHKGTITTTGRRSPYSLYDENVASMEGVQSDYNPDDASGFIRLQGLRLRARARAHGYSA